MIEKMKMMKKNYCEDDEKMKKTRKYDVRKKKKRGLWEGKEGRVCGS